VPNILVADRRQDILRAAAHVEITASVQTVAFNVEAPPERYEQPQAVKLMLVAMPGAARIAAGQR